MTSRIYAEANPWRAKTIEWQLPSPPPRFNFERIPRVIGGPYEFGVPGTVHALLGEDEIRVHRARTATQGQSPAASA